MKRKIWNLVGQMPQGIATKNALIDFFSMTVKENEICDKFISDSESEGDCELAEFFKEIQAQDHLRAERAKELIHRRLFSR